MNVFKKLFSGSSKQEDDANSEYLNDAYSSLGDEENLNPDRIIDENSMIVSETDDYGFQSAEADNSGVSLGLDSRQDKPEGDFVMSEINSEVEVNETNTEPYYVADDYTEQDLYSEPFDAEKAYNNLAGDADELDADKNVYYDLGGDTGELDAAVIRAEAQRVDDYISGLENAEHYEDYESSGDIYGEDYEIYDNTDSDKAAEAAESLNEEDNSEADKELIYSAYAPKSMRPQITQKLYYDLEDIDNEAEEIAEPHGFSAFLKKRGKWVISGAAAAVVVVGIIVACVFVFSGGMDPLMGYSQTNAVKGNVIKTMAAGGNVEPNARYEITSLVNGTITESPLNAGEEVKAGELVYKVDDTNAQLAVQMAQNSVERAKASGTSSSSDNLKIYANASGTITDLKISSGSTINGGQIATITQSNGTEIGLIANVSGTVQSLNVREGSSVTSGQVIATLKSSDSSNSQEGQKLDIAGSELALEQAEKELEKYKIASPIDGTILVKNAKIGDNVTAGKTDQPLMVIADMSKMKFTIEVDELDIWNIQLGQTVVITANALPGETFSGEITNIAGEGEKKGSGVTTYAVEITISEPGKIKSGMNVDAKIIINSAINVLTLPEQALYESDGRNALVITNSSGVDEDDIMNSEDYPNINVPDGYKLVKVQYGVSDGTNVEITSGLSVGDIVLYKENSADASANNADSSSKSLNTNSSGAAESKRSGNSSSDNSDDFNDYDDSDSLRDADDTGDNVKSTGKSALQSELDI